MDAQAWVALAALSFLMICAFVGMAAWLLSRIEVLRDDLHGRINKVKDDYLRRDDLSTHLKPLQEGLEAMRDDIRDLTGILREHKGKV